MGAHLVFEARSIGCDRSSSHDRLTDDERRLTYCGLSLLKCLTDFLWI